MSRCQWITYWALTCRTTVQPLLQCMLAAVIAGECNSFLSINMKKGKFQAVDKYLLQGASLGHLVSLWMMLKPLVGTLILKLEGRSMGVHLDGHRRCWLQTGTRQTTWWWWMMRNRSRRQFRTSFLPKKLPWKKRKMFEDEVQSRAFKISDQWSTVTLE